MNPQFVKDTIHKLMELFERQDFSEVLRHTIIRRHPDDTVPSDKWSLGNRLLMVLSGTLDARGYKQWLDVGRHVRKGETSIKIVAPILRRSKKEVADDTEPAFQLVGFCPIAVFAVESTDGKPLPEYHYAPPELPPLWPVAKKLGINVRYAPFSGNDLGYYQPGRQQIVLKSQDAFVFYHELAHAVHNSFAPIRKGELARAEVVAEMTAAVLCQMQGVSGYENSAYRYMARYAKGKDDKAVLQFILGTLTEVEQVVNRILALSAAEETSTSIAPPIEAKSA